MDNEKDLFEEFDEPIEIFDEDGNKSEFYLIQKKFKFLKIVFVMRKYLISARHLTKQIRHIGCFRYCVRLTSLILIKFMLRFRRKAGLVLHFTTE